MILKKVVTILVAVCPITSATEAEPLLRGVNVMARLATGAKSTSKERIIDASVETDDLEAVHFDDVDKFSPEHDRLEAELSKKLETMLGAKEAELEKKLEVKLEAELSKLKAANVAGLYDISAKQAALSNLSRCFDVVDLDDGVLGAVIKEGCVLRASHGDHEIHGSVQIHGDHITRGNHATHGHHVIKGGNLYVHDGSGSPMCAAVDGIPKCSGVGNILMGHAPGEEASVHRSVSGSHNIILGKDHVVSSHGAIVSGTNHSVIAPHASAIGGSNNTARGHGSLALGGSNNTAGRTTQPEPTKKPTNPHELENDGYTKGDFAVVLGGNKNQASGPKSSVVGGKCNHASGTESSVTGGSHNEASGQGSSVTGGLSNQASGGHSSVVSGQNNKASGKWSSVLGGGSETASEGNVAKGQFATVTGGAMNLAEGRGSSVFGGSNNAAVKSYSSVVPAPTPTQQKKGKSPKPTPSINNLATIPHLGPTPPLKGDAYNTA